MYLRHQCAQLELEDLQDFDVAGGVVDPTPHPTGESHHTLQYHQSNLAKSYPNPVCMDLDPLGVLGSRHKHEIRANPVTV
jgi:hypothetical protein